MTTTFPTSPQPSPPDYSVIPHASYPDGEIKRFAESRLNQSINDALSQMSPGKTVGVFAFVEKDGHQDPVGRFAAVAKVGDHWSAVGVLSHTFKPGPDDTSWQAGLRWEM